MRLRLNDTAPKDQTTDNKLKEEDDHDRRQVELTERRQESPCKTENRFGDLPQRVVHSHHGAAAAQREPRENDPHENDEQIQVEQLTQEFAHVDDDSVELRVTRSGRLQQKYTGCDTLH